MPIRSPRHVFSSFAILAVLLVSAPSIAGGQSHPASLAEHPRVAESLRLVDAWMEAERAYEVIPGISIAVVYDQELLWTGEYGYANLEEGTPIRPETLYRGCSIAKLFTATGVMQLRDLGSLALDDPVRRHLPWFGSRNPSTDAGTVTVEALLTHSSGLPRDLPYSYWTGPDYPFPTRARMIEDAGGLARPYPARTGYRYSNLGMSLAGEIVAAVSGTRFETYIRRRIFRPLDMVDSYIDPPVERLGESLATGYTVPRRDGSRSPVPAYRVHGLAPAAGLVTSVRDLARFASWQFRTLAGDDDATLDRSSMAAMHRVQWMDPDGWSRTGYGYQTWAENDRHFVGHAGACPGYESKLLLRPAEKIATIVMTNSQGPNVDGYAQRIYDVMRPAIRSALRDPSPVVSQTEVEAVASEWVGHYQRPLGGESVVIAWGDALAVLRLPAASPLRSIEVLERIEHGEYQLEGSDGMAVDRIRFTRDDEGRLRMWRGHQYSIRQSR